MTLRIDHRAAALNVGNVLIIFGNVHFPFSSSKQKRFIVNNAGVINLIFRSAKLKAHLTRGTHGESCVGYVGGGAAYLPFFFFKHFDSSIFVL